MSTLSFMFSAVVTLSILCFVFVMGTTHWLYFVVLPPLLVVPFITRLARLPRRADVNRELSYQRVRSFE